MGYIDGKFMLLVRPEMETCGVQFSGKLEKSCRLICSHFTHYSLLGNDFRSEWIFFFESDFFFICDIQHLSHIHTLLSEMLNHFFVYFSRSLKGVWAFYDFGK